MDLTRFKAMTFDCYGTLIDWETGLLKAFDDWLKDKPSRPADSALLEAYSRYELLHERKRPALLYPAVLRAVVGDIAEEFNVAISEAEKAAFAESIRRWPAFADTPGALAYLKRHFKLVITSNVDRESFRHTNETLGVMFDKIVTAEDVGAYKPDLAHFHRAIAEMRAMDIEPGEILHVAESLYHDIPPAQAAGFGGTVWVNRRHGKAGAGATPLTDAKPDLTVTSLAALAELHQRQLAALPAG